MFSLQWQEKTEGKSLTMTALRLFLTASKKISPNYQGSKVEMPSIASFIPSLRSSKLQTVAGANEPEGNVPAQVCW